MFCTFVLVISAQFCADSPCASDNGADYCACWSDCTCGNLHGPVCSGTVAAIWGAATLDDTQTIPSDCSQFWCTNERTACLYYRSPSPPPSPWWDLTHLPPPPLPPGYGCDAQCRCNCPSGYQQVSGGCGCVPDPLASGGTCDAHNECWSSGTDGHVPEFCAVRFDSSGRRFGQCQPCETNGCGSLDPINNACPPRCLKAVSDEFVMHQRCNTGCGEAPSLAYAVHTHWYGIDICYRCSSDVHNFCRFETDDVNAAISPVQNVGWWQADTAMSGGGTGLCTDSESTCTCCFAFQCHLAPASSPPPPHPPQMPRPPGRGWDLHEWGAATLETRYDERWAMKLQTLAHMSYASESLVEQKLSEFLCGCYVPTCDGPAPGFVSELPDARCHECGACTWADVGSGFSWAYYEGGSWYGFGDDDANAALVLHDHVSDVTIIAFRGTDPHRLTNILQDADFVNHVTLPGSQVQVHSGFYNAFTTTYSLNAKHCQDQVLARCEQSSMRQFLTRHHRSTSQLLLTGHSLGAAMATVAAYYLHTIELWPVTSVVTFASPRVGHGASLQSHFLNSSRAHGG